MNDPKRMSNNVSDAPPAASNDALNDLTLRLSRYRATDVAPVPGWSRGVPLDYLADLIEYWRSEYDWRVHEARIRSLPWTTAGREHPLRLIHQTADPAAPTVLFLHGWPDSILRFERILPKLANVNVVMPALPGYPFALPVPEGGLSIGDMASPISDAMSDLGYERYIVSAGDVGCDVAEVLAAENPAQVAALHLTDVSQLHYLVDPPADLSDAEKEYVRHGQHWQATEGAYSHEQATKPQTLAVGLGDSPAGLAAWILEKLHGWTDCDGDVESVFSRDELLTWISAYWFDGSIGTSFSPYAGGAVKSWPRLVTPTAFTIFPKDLVNAPKEFADRFFNVKSWQEFDRGGHFAAWERPDDYLSGVRAATALAAG